MLSKKPEILFFPFNLLSHYVRCLELAKYYEADYGILFKSSTRYNHLIRAAGFGTFECKDFDAEYVSRCMRKYSFKWINEKDLEFIYNSQVNAIREYEPALVIGDMAPTLKMACEKLGVKYISVINGYMSKYYALERPVGETHPAYLIKKFIPADIFSAIAQKQEQKAFEKIHRPFGKLRAKHGLSPRSNYLDELEGDETLICDHEHIFPLKDAPSGYRYVGPLLSPAETIAEVGFTKAAPAKTILITMGSSGDWHKLSTLNAPVFSEYNFIVLGDKERILKANHFKHYDFVNLRSVLLVTDLVICHGGNGTLNYCYDMKVPFIALPSMIEQEWNALRFQQVMRGKTISKRITANMFLHAINNLTGSNILS